MVFLVGGWTNPVEKYARQNRNLSQVGMNIKKYLKPPPSFFFQEPLSPLKTNMTIVGKSPNFQIDTSSFMLFFSSQLMLVFGGVSPLSYVHICVDVVTHTSRKPVEYTPEV